MAAEQDRNTAAIPARTRRRIDRGGQFTRPGHTKVERNRDLPVDRQIRALLKNPTPSPANRTVFAN